MSCDRHCCGMVSPEEHKVVVAKQRAIIDKLCLMCLVLIVAILVSNLMWLVYIINL